MCVCVCVYITVMYSIEIYECVDLECMINVRASGVFQMDESFLLQRPRLFESSL